MAGHSAESMKVWKVVWVRFCDVVDDGVSGGEGCGKMKLTSSGPGLTQSRSTVKFNSRSTLRIPPGPWSL